MISSLPPDLLSVIACHLSPSARDVLSLAQSCRSARDACWGGRRDALWRTLAAERWGPLVDEPDAAEAAEAVGGWREYYLRRSSLRLVRGKAQPRRPASARALFWVEEDDPAVNANDDTTNDDQNHASAQPHFLALGPNGTDRSPLDLVQEAYQPEPWHVVVACMLIARTSGGATPLATIARFLEHLPTPTSVVQADDAFVESLLQPLGLQRNRRASVKAAGRAFLTAAWKDPSELRGCGKFCSDSWRVFCRGEVGSVRGIDDAMLRQFVRWCGGGSGGGGAKAGESGGSAQKRRREAVEKGLGAGTGARRQKQQQQQGGDVNNEVLLALAAAKAGGGRVTRARAAAAKAEDAAKGGRSARAARRRGSGGG
jgi:hypothetical protein